MKKQYKKRVPIDEGVYNMATRDVLAGRGLRWTADFYGINHTTLYYRVHAERKRRECLEQIIGDDEAFAVHFFLISCVV